MVEDGGGVDDVDAELAVDVGAFGVVDAGDDAEGVVDVFGDLGGHGVAVVAVGEGEEDVGLGDAGGVLDFEVFASAEDGVAAEVVIEPVEGGGVNVDDGDVVAFVIEFAGEGGAESSAAHDHDAH